MPSEQTLAGAYRSKGVAEEYRSRHCGSLVRRLVSRREAKIVVSLFGGLPEGALLLNAACGIGRHSQSFDALGFRTVSLDASLDMILEGCRANSLHPGAAINGSVFSLPFRDKSFDGSACIRFLHHLSRAEQRIAVLKEFSRVTKGPVVISFWTGFSLQTLRRSLKHGLGKRPSSRYRIGLATFKKELDEAGWVMDRFRYLHRFMSETAYARLLPVKRR